MIDYDSGKYQIALIFQLHGSVFPKACVFAVPTTLCAVIVHIFVKDFRIFGDEEFEIMHNNAAYSGFSFVVGFLLVFRTSQAYTRFWEGTTLMQMLRGQWVGAFSSILAFSSGSTNDKKAIDDFRHKLVRLFSLLHATALRYAATLTEEEEEFDIIGILGLDDQTIRFIHDTSEDTKIYVTIQWIQQLIISNLNTGILPVPAPIISRVFQDLSTGIVTLNNARKISDTPFPFPYVQMMTAMLLMHMCITPFIVVTWCDKWYWSAAFTFAPVFAFWCINFIAAEIEQPFGGDVNDINVAELQNTMNRSLVAMLDYHVFITPALKETAELDRTNLVEKADTLSVAYDISRRSNQALKNVKPINRKLVEDLLKTPLVSSLATRTHSLYSDMSKAVEESQDAAAAPAKAILAPAASVPSAAQASLLKPLRAPGEPPGSAANVHAGVPRERDVINEQRVRNGEEQDPVLELLSEASKSVNHAPQTFSSEHAPPEKERHKLGTGSHPEEPHGPGRPPDGRYRSHPDEPQGPGRPPESARQTAPGQPAASRGIRPPEGPQPLHLSVDAEGFSLRVKR